MRFHLRFFVFTFLLMFCLVDGKGQQKVIVVVDKDSGQPIEDVLLMSPIGSNGIVFVGKTDKNGKIEISRYGDRNDSISNITLLRTGYSSGNVKITNKDVDTFKIASNINLHEIEVLGYRNLVTFKPDRIIYDVGSDSSAQKEKAIETLRKVPGLIVNRKGEISSDFGKDIVFKLNGLSDPLIASPAELLNVLGSEHIKRFEVVLQPPLNYGSNAMVLNVVTKGRLEGYMLTGSTRLSDCNWYNSVWGSTKVKRFRISGSFAHNWMYGHTSSGKLNEWRLNSSSNYLTSSQTKSFGTKSHDNNFELSASYDLGEKTLLSVFGRAFLRNNMHWNNRIFTQVTQSNDCLNYSYIKKGHNKLVSPEYQASLYFEHLYGEDENEGKFFMGYNYYKRPYEETRYVEYDSIMGGNEDLCNYIREERNSEDWHTFEMEFRTRSYRNHSITLDLKGLARIEDSRFGIDFQQRSNNANDFYRKQYLVTPLIAYTFSNNKYSWSLATRIEADHEKMERKSHQTKYNNTFYNILPSADFSMNVSSRVLLSIDYDMSVLRPSISALDPFIDSSSVNRLSYGNSKIKPQRNQKISFTSHLRLGNGDAWYVGLALSYLYSDRIILKYNDLVEDILHITVDNIGYRNVGELQLSLRKRFGNLFLRTTSTVDYVSYSAPRLSQSNKGFTYNVRCMAEYELPKDYFLEFEGVYRSKNILLQGNGSDEYRYGFTLSKNFLRNKLRLLVSAENFAPIHKTDHSDLYTQNYVEKRSSRYYNATFMFSARYNWGNLKSHVKKTKKTIEDIDIKRDYNE